jgi:acyl-coenzyme A synthetase/AMP-(fatty) acid ligase
MDLMYCSSLVLGTDLRNCFTTGWWGGGLLWEGKRAPRCSYKQHPDVTKYDLSSVEVVDCAAAPLSAPLQRSLSARLGIDGIRNGYGLSEVVAGAVIPPPDRTLEMQRKGSVGFPMPSIEVS